MFLIILNQNNPLNDKYQRNNIFIIQFLIKYISIYMFYKKNFTIFSLKNKNRFYNIIYENII